VTIRRSDSDIRIDGLDHIVDGLSMDS
jgi:hypothetical protein